MKIEKLKLLMNKVVEFNQPNVIYCKGFLYKDSGGYYISVVENAGDISNKDKIYLKDGDEDYITKAEKPKLMRVSLKSWHYRLVKKVLKSNAPTPKTMQNGCPYYWLLVFSLFVYPFILLAKGVWFIIMLFPMALMLVLEQMVYSWLDGLDEEQVYGYHKNQQGFSGYMKMPLTTKFFMRNRNNSDFLDYFMNEKYGLNDRYDTEYIEKKQELESKYIQWRKEFDERRAKSESLLSIRRQEIRKKREEREHKAQLRKEKWENRMKPITEGFSKFRKSLVAKDWNTIIRRTKQFVGTIITIVLLFISFSVVVGVSYGLTAFVDLSIKYWYVFVGAGIVAVIIGILYVLYLFFTGWAQTLINKYKGGKKVWYIEPFIYAIYYPLKYVVLGIAYGFYHVIGLPSIFIFYTIIWKSILVPIGKFIWSLLKSFGRGVGGSTGIFGEYFSASYTAYCPGIEWVDTEEEDE